MDEEVLAVNDIDQTAGNTWQIIKKRKHYNEIRAPDTSFQIVTNNRFQPFLSEVGHETETPQTTPMDSTTTQITEPKPPPIHIHGVNDFKAMTANLSTIVPAENYHTKTLANNTVSIYPHTSATYRKLIPHLKKHNIIFHTYQLKQDRAYRIVLRDIHPTVPTQEIADELTKKGHHVRNIINIRHRITKEPLPLFFVDLEPHPNNKTIFDISHLLNAKIRVEPPRTKKTIIQCTRCQEYGHSKSYCNKPFNCVKCGQTHDSKVCTKIRDTPATCALCQGNHPANYKGCRIYQELIAAKNNRQIKRPPLTQNNSNHTTFPSNPTASTPQQDSLIHSTPTYAHIVSQTNQTTPTDHIPTFTSFLQEFKNMFSQLLHQNTMIMTMLTSLLNKLTK
jgi:hypothetical protein